MNERVGGHGATAAGDGMVGDLQRFINEKDKARTIDRELRTLANLQRLAAFLEGFPGRKNIIWFSEKPPGVFLLGGDPLHPVLDTGNPALDDEIKKTLAMLGTARAAIYPVDPRGLLPNFSEDTTHDQLNAQILAEESGGRAFANMNGFSDIIDKVTSDSGHFFLAPALRKLM